MVIQYAEWVGWDSLDSMLRTLQPPLDPGVLVALLAQPLLVQLVLEVLFPEFLV